MEIRSLPTYSFGGCGELFGFTCLNMNEVFLLFLILERSWEQGSQLGLVVLRVEILYLVGLERKEVFIFHVNPLSMSPPLI
jgi:hypothetical protein